MGLRARVGKLNWKFMNNILYNNLIENRVLLNQFIYSSHMTVILKEKKGINKNKETDKQKKENNMYTYERNIA